MERRRGRSRTTGLILHISAMCLILNASEEGGFILIVCQMLLRGFVIVSVC